MYEGTTIDERGPANSADNPAELRIRRLTNLQSPRTRICGQEVSSLPGKYWPVSNLSNQPGPAPEAEGSIMTTVVAMPCPFCLSSTSTLRDLLARGVR